MIKAATTAALVVWQKSPNWLQNASQFASSLPLCAKYTMAAEAPAADVVNVIMA